MHFVPAGQMELYTEITQLEGQASRGLFQHISAPSLSS